MEKIIFLKKNKITELGFTLIEIMVVIGIMVVLSVIAYSSFDVSKAQSRDQKRISDISVIQLALEQYFQKYGVYPVSLNSLVPTYIFEISKDPTTKISYSENYFPITKTSSSDYCISYQLWTKFERNNVYLDSKKGFNSSAQPLSNSLYECGSGHNKINASDPSNSLIYDVMP